MKILILMLLSVNTFAQQPKPKKVAKKEKKDTVAPRLKPRKIPLFY
jgi:hypothetical protein